ncbi:MAG: AAA family ATPase, partial [Thermodesulfobacteriota bacterium]
MYQSLFGLTRRPFALTADPFFLYASPDHDEALAHLTYGLQDNAGLMLLTGAPGCGKTTIVRALCGQLDDRRALVLLESPNLSPAELIAAIVADLGGPVADSKAANLRALDQAVADLNRQGRPVLLVVDEAQSLPADSLDELRMLGSRQQGDRFLIQILLAGQPALREALGQPELASLRQRIGVACHLAALPPHEVAAYILHRLHLAGAAEPAAVFTPAALELVSRQSQGIPRLVSALCDAALLAAFGDGCRQVDGPLMHKVIALHAASSWDAGGAAPAEAAEAPGTKPGAVPDAGVEARWRHEESPLPAAVPPPPQAPVPAAAPEATGYQPAFVHVPMQPKAGA